MLILIIILAVVFVLIAVRQVGNVKLQIWQIMLAGAVVFEENYKDKPLKIRGYIM